LLENGTTYMKSDAALRLAKHLDGVWELGTIFLIVPKFIRNPIYDWVARNRYGWFGKKEMCWIPEKKWRDRFIE
ncbi:MAG: DCC1-like thiol-disulfide oxidoreductase family protein, partial [Flavobacteriales bacterium]|nr:DCC1-like thiol-disulfide oxidoreductase family protein [Flavobacteriales bacterium]